MYNSCCNYNIFFNGIKTSKLYFFFRFKIINNIPTLIPYNQTIFTAIEPYIASIESLLSHLHSQDKEHDTVETVRGILQEMPKSWYM